MKIGRWTRILIAIPIIYFSWLGMMLVHESGHVLHALLSGGQIRSISIPLLGFSQTLVWPSPRELFVVWGGPMWGVIIPLSISGAILLILRRVPEVFKFFTGFCLIANGMYIGLGWRMHAGDAADMTRLGTPVWMMILFGAVCTAAGLFLWHRTRGMSMMGVRHAPDAVV